MDKIPITVIIPAKNEEINLRKCLPQLKPFSEVFVIDSQSSDNTKEITLEHNCKYIEFIWDGKYPKKRNWALNNLELRNNWVLFLDADEFVTNEFLEEVSSIKLDNYNGYWIQYTNYFLGKKLTYGDPMKKLAMFKVGEGMYEYIKEENWSNLDMEVHEHPVINEPVGSIKAQIIHNDFRGLTHYIKKHNEYSTWEAHRYLNAISHEKFTFRQKIKYQLLYNPFFPMMYFIYSYILRLGFLDGIAGLIFNIYKSIYFFQIFTKIYENKKQNRP